MTQFPARADCWNQDADRTGWDQLEQQLLLWMGNVNYTAEIFHIPLFLVLFNINIYPGSV